MPQFTHPPHVSSAQSMMFGKSTPNAMFCQSVSNFDSQKSGNQVMSKQKALNLLDRTYKSSKSISETEKVSDWKMAKKVYYLHGLGVNPEKYGMSKAEINSIRRDGLVKYKMNV